MTYLGRWYTKMEPTWKIVGNVQTIIDPRMTGHNHDEMAHYHWTLAKSENYWRRNLLIDMGLRRGNLNEVPEILAKSRNKSLGLVLADAWKNSVERQKNHVHCAQWHLQQRDAKECRLIDILEARGQL